MREHRYRGKRIDNGEWLFGSLVVDTRLDIKSYEIVYFDEECHAHQVYINPETVGEYTGLQDKDKTEICEHDILHIEIINSFTGDIAAADNAVVEYRDGMYGVLCGRDFTALNGFSKQFAWFTVVGTKFDNPELLQEASKSE